MRDPEKFFDAGFTDLIPLRRGDKRPMGRWTELVATRDMVSKWTGNLGLRTAYYPTIDIDVLDEDLSAQLANLTRTTFGYVPTRVGAAPKRALVYRTKTPFRKRWVQFRRGDESYRVEVLCGGQYVVIAGMHPSGTDYSWDQPPRANKLPFITEEQVESFLNQVAEFVEAGGWEVTSTRASAEDMAGVAEQASLAGNLSEVSNAVRSLPNTSDIFPGREDYLKLGVAIKAALPEHPEIGFGLWLDWCARWKDGHNEPELVQRDWDSLRPPFRLGADYLYDLARAYSDGSEAMLMAGEDFSDLPLDDPPDEPRDPAPAFSHAWLAHRFQRAYGSQVRYCKPLGGWLRWDGSRWLMDELGLVGHWASRVCLDAMVDPTSTMGLTPAKKDANKRFAASNQAVEGTLDYSARSPDVVVAVAALDADPWKLNTPRGVVDLRLGTFRPNRPEFLLTKQTSVGPDMQVPTPKWTAFLDEATGGDRDLVLYLQRLAGYCLTGSTREHVLAFLYGTGGNGKSVFLNTLIRVFGSYAQVSAMTAFVASRFDSHPTDLAQLVGSRMVTAQETQEGRSWDEARIKSITGGDPVSARFLYQNLFTYRPQFKILFAGNHKPRLHNVDAATQRRFHLVPFTATPATVNRNLSEELVAEMPGILQWAIEGCLEWQKEGLNPPLAVRRATEEYFEDEDATGRWITARTTDAAASPTPTRDLYSDWAGWCSENGEDPGTQRSFTAALRSQGVQEGRTANARGFALTLAPRVSPVRVQPTTHPAATPVATEYDLSLLDGVH